MARKVITGLNLTTELQSNGSAGTLGQVLLSGGSGAVPSWGTFTGITASSYAAVGVLAADQALTVSGTDTPVSFVDYVDPQGWWNPTTKRFTPTIAGYYNITFQTLWTPLTSTSQTNTQIRKNGNSETIQQRSPDANNPYFMSASKVIYLNGSTDYIEFTAWSPVTTQSLSQGNAAGSGTNFSAQLITSGANITSNALTVGTSGLTMTTGSSPWTGSAAATIDIDTTKVPRLSQNNTFTGVNSFNNAVNIGGGSVGAVGLEIGSTLGSATTPFIDFHSGATAIDFDSRIIASGGNGTNGQGTLTYTAATNTFTGTVTATSLIRSGGTTNQFLKANGDVDSNTYLPTTSSYFAGHNPEGRLMYNTYLTNDMANARLRGSAVAATQNGSAYSISNANWDAMFDGTATFFNISPTSGFTFPLVITVPLPRTLTYGAWVGLSFGSTTFRANSVTIEVFSLDSSSWVTVFTTTTNTSEDIFTSVSGLTNSNATGINQVRYTISAPNSTQLRLQHLWAYNFNSDMWSQTMMPRAGGTIYGAITVPDRITLKAVANAGNQSNGLLLSNTADAWQSGLYLKTDGSGNPRLTLLAPTGALGEAVSIDSAAKVGFNNITPTGQVDITTASTTRVPLIIRPQASQTADMLQVRNSADNANLARITSSGDASFGAMALGNGTIYGSSSLINIASTGAGQIGAIIKASSSQATDHIQYQSSAGTILGGVNGVGQFYTGSTTPILSATGGTIQSIATGANPLVTMASAHGLTTGDLATLAGTTGGTYNGTFVVASTPLTTTFTITSALTAGQAGTGGTVSDPAQASVTARSAGTTGLIVRGASSQAANFFEIQNSAGSVQASLSSNSTWQVNGIGITTGDHRVGTATYFSAALNVLARTTTEIGMVVRGQASQTADILQIQSSAGTALGGHNRIGQLYTGSTTPILSSTGGIIQSIATGANPLVTMASAHGLTTGDLVTLASTTGGTYNGTFVVASTPLTTTFTITTALTTGQAGIGGIVTSPVQASITARSASTTGLIVRGAASQIASVQEWQNSSGTVTGYVRPDGNAIIFGGVEATYYMTTTAGTTSNVPMTVYGQASHTANLQEWRRLTEGTPRAFITPTGNMVYHVDTNARTANYTLALVDDGDVVEMNVSSANSVTIPLNSTVAFPVGTQITVIQTGTGQTSIAVAAGVTLNATPQTGANTAKLRAQWSSLTLLKRPNGANLDTWVAIGDLVA